MARVVGRRMRIVTNHGEVTTAPASPLEWEMQAAAVRKVKALPNYRGEVIGEMLPSGTFAIAGDFNAGKRGKKDQVSAKATGLAPGGPDLQIYCHGGKLAMIGLRARGQIEDHGKKVIAFGADGWPL